MDLKHLSHKRKLAIGVAAALAVAGGGAAIAATQLGSPREESQAILNDAATQLGVEPGALSDALKKALSNRVDAWVEAGRLTKEQGAELKQRIESGEVPLLGLRAFGHHGPHGHGASLDAAAEYLGLTEDALREELESGKTLAQVARDHDKSVDGLVQALYDEAKGKLDDAVADGRLTRAQADAILEDLKPRITAFVNGERGRAFRFGPRFEPGFRSWAPRFSSDPIS
jgi:polyhydroxyalkanoate synthesis regulator phasin